MVLFEQPMSIFEHLNLIKKCENIYVRKYASLILSRLFRTHLHTLKFEQVLSIQESLLQLITNDTDLYVRYFLCDSVFTFLSTIENTPTLWASFTQNDQPWLNIFDLANQLVKNQYLLSTGLHLWQNIYVLFPYSGSNELLFALLTITSTALLSTSSDDRLQALKLIDHLRGNIPDQLGSESQAAVVQTVLQSLLDEMNLSIYSGYDIDEIGLVIKVVAAFLDNPPPFLEFEHLSIFFELAFTVLTEISFPTKIRLMVHRIIESSVDMIVDNYRDRLNILIQISVELSLEVCNQQRDDNNYEFPISFFYTIVDAYDSESEGIFELFLSFANRLILTNQDNEVGPAQRQVALLIITSIIEGTQEIVSERINDVMQFVLQIADYDDPYVFASACNTLNELIEYVTSAISLYVEDIASYIIQYVAKYTNDAIMLLDNLFSKCGRVPKDTDRIFNDLTALINQPNIHFEQIEMIISCISSLLLQSNSPDAYISSFLPYLNKIYQHRPDLRDVIFNFYGDAVIAAPLAVKKDLPILAKMILSTLESADHHIQDEANFQFFQAAALCLKQIAQILPVSLISLSIPQQSVPFLLKMISLNESDPLKIQNFKSADECLFMHSQSAALSCLLTFLGYMPNTMQQFLQDPLLEFLFQRHDLLPSYIISICNSLAESIQGFHILGISLSDLIITIITKIFLFTEKKEVIISILTMLTEVTITYKSEIFQRQDVLHTIITSLYQILTVPPLGFLKTEHSNYIDQQIQLPLFQFIREIIFALFEFDLNLSTTIMTNVLVPSILPYMKSYSSLMKGNSIELLSQIIFCLATNINIIRNNNPSEETKASLQQLSELTENLNQIATDAGFEVIANLQNIETRRIVARAFMFLIPFKRDFFVDKLDILIPFSIELIEFCGFTGLWSILAICFPPNFVDYAYLEPLKCGEHSIYNSIQFALISHLDEEKEVNYKFDMFNNFAVAVAVINEIPGGIDFISLEADFIYFMKNQISSISNDYNNNDSEANLNICNISSLLDEKLPMVAVTLFTASDNEFKRATNQVKAALAQVIMGMNQETLTELVNANEAKLVNLQRHLHMINTFDSGSS